MEEGEHDDQQLQQPGGGSPAPHHALPRQQGIVFPTSRNFSCITEKGPENNEDCRLSRCSVGFGLAKVPVVEAEISRERLSLEGYGVAKLSVA